MATFTDSSGALAPLQYAASINWGDGSAFSGGKVVNTSGNNFEVFGSHAYADQSVPGPAYTISVSVARGDLLANAGFELPVGFGSYASIPGWTLASGTGGGTIEIAGNNIGTPYEGTQFTELNSAAPATIFQAVTTSPGQKYTFSFAFSARPGATAADNDVQVSVGGSTITTITADGSSLSNTSWTDRAFSYTATSASTTIQFASLSPAGDSVGGELDAVQLAPLTSSAVTTTTQVVNEAQITLSSVTPFATVGSGPDGLAFDKSGNLYVANFFDNTVDKVTPGGVVSTFINTGLNGPKGLAFDSSGNLFVANFNIGEIAEYNSSGALITAGFNATGFAGAPDQLVIDSGNNLYLYTSAGDIYKITPAGAVSTYVSGLSGNAGGLAFDAGGDLFVTDFNNNQVDKVPPGGGSFSVFASGFNQPRDLVVDSSGNLYVSNGNNNSISKVTSGGSVSTYVSGGPFNYPYALALDAAGNLYVTNGGGNTVVKVTPPQSFTINEGAATPAITGLATFTDPAGAEPVADYTTTINWGDGATSPGTVVNTGGNNFRVDAPAHKYSEEGVYAVLVTVQHETAAQQSVVAATVTVNEVPITNLAASGAGPVTTFATVGNEPDGLAFDKSGNLYAANFVDNTIDKVTPGGVVSTFINSGLNGPKGLAFDNSGNLFVASFYNGSIAKYNSAGTLVTGAFNTTSISRPDQMVIDSGNNLYVYDLSGNIDKITPAGAVSTYVSGLNSTIGGLAFDASGDLFVTDFVDGQVDKVPPGGGSFSVFASGVPSGRDIVIDASGNPYVSDDRDNAIYKVAPGGSISTYVSGGLLNGPYALALDAGGNLYVTNSNGNTVIKVTPPQSFTINEGAATPAITGIATFTDPAGAEPVADYTTTINWGDGTATTAGTVVNTGGNNFRVDAPAHKYSEQGVYNVTVTVQHETAAPLTVAAATVTVNEAQLTGLSSTASVTTFATVGPGPDGLAFDKSGNLYVADVHDDTIDKVTPSRIVTTFISGNGVHSPSGLAFDSSGNLFVANFFSNSIAEYNSAGTLVTGTFNTTPINRPDQMVIDSGNNLYVYDGSGNIDKITPAGAVSTYVSGLNSINGGLAFDASGDLFVTDYSDDQVDKVPPGGGAFSVFASGVPNGRDIVIDGSGNLYVSDDGDNAIYKVAPGGSISTYVSGGLLNGPYALALDAGGNLYVTNSNGNTVVKVTPPQSFTINEGAATPAITGIATFTDPAGAEAVADYAATINWGDNTTSPGSVVNTGGNNFRIDAPAHTYTGLGTYNVTVAVTHETAPTLTVSAATVTVPAAQPSQVTADQDNNGNVQISFQAPAVNGLAVTYQVMRSVNGGAYANAGSPIASTGAASYTFQDPGPLVDGSSYTYEVNASGSATPPTASNTIEYLFNPLVSHPTFSSAETDLKFNNGSGAPAAINDVNQVQLTNNTGGEANSVYAANPVQINGNWQTSFDFQISNPGADGLTFVIQAQGSSAVGQSGGALGFTGTNNVAAGGIARSVGFAFNQYNGVTQTAFGADVTGAGATLAPYIGMDGTLGNAFHPASNTTDLFQVSLSYDSATGNFYEVVRDTANGLGFTNAYTPAYYTAFNSTLTKAALNALFSGADGQLYAGFTGATGGVASTQTIDDWTFNTAQGAPVAVQPVSISANEATGGLVLIAFPAPRRTESAA